MKVVYFWLKEYVGDKLPDAEATAGLLTDHAFEIDGVEEIDGETVIDVDVLPNRGSDCLCHRGVARELATILDTSLVKDPLSIKPELKTTDAVEIEIKNPEACFRFTTSVIKGIDVKESPAWLQQRLRALGQKPINNIVDATNYVMLAIGQPLHAYDADLLKQAEGKYKFLVRTAKEGEKVSLLAEGGKDEERVIELAGGELLIVDGNTDTAIGLAGVKGGKYAEVNQNTKNIIIEAANFDPVLIRKTARGLGIVIESSKRFENAPSPELPTFAQKEIIDLILEIAGGEYLGTADVYPTKPEPKAVTVRQEKVNKLLGLELSLAEIESIIKRTGADITNKTADELTAVAPFERSDLNIEPDYIEEVARINGLDKIKTVAPVPQPLEEINPLQYYSEKVRQVLVDQGFSEVITSSFHKKGQIQLHNALASDKSYVRGNLTKNLHDVLDANFTHTDLLGIKDVRVFEIGTVFSKNDTGITEHVSLAIGVRTKGNGYNQKDDAQLSAVLDVVHEALDVQLSFSVEKAVAEINFTAVIESLPAPTAYEKATEFKPVTFKAFSAYPAMARDISLWVGESVLATDIEKILQQEAGELCVRITLFDTFTKDGRTSYAFRLVFQASDRTLTDDEINPLMENIYKVVSEKGWEVR